MPLPSGRQQIVLEQFSINDTTDIRLCYRCGEEGHIRKYCNTKATANSVNRLHITHQYAGHMQTS